jgi:hypothetical protein
MHRHQRQKVHREQQQEYRYRTSERTIDASPDPAFEDAAALPALQPSRGEGRQALDRRAVRTGNQTHDGGVTIFADAASNAGFRSGLLRREIAFVNIRRATGRCSLRLRDEAMRYRLCDTAYE